MNELQPHQNPRQIQSYVLGIILILLFVVVCRLFAPFFTVLLWSILLYIMLSPLHRRLIRNLNFNSMKGKILRNIWAGVFAVGTIIIILLPLLFIVFLFIRQVLELGYFIRDILYNKPDYLHDIFLKISRITGDVFGELIDVSPDKIIQELGGIIGKGLNFAGSISTGIALNIVNFIVSILLMLFTLFFLFVDGPYLSRLALRAIPIKSEYRGTLSAKFLDITRNLFFGYIIVALLQSVVAYIIFVIFGIEGPLVLAVITFFLTFIPVIGAGIMYIPLGFLQIAEGDTTSGIIFLVLCVVFISGIDSVLRPFFMRDRLNLHPLIIFFAILGGLAVFGFNGFILGPVLVILFLTVLDIFLIEHRITSNEQPEAVDKNNNSKT
jgi:predicted PurR-regulated permease PerM